MVQFLGVLNQACYSFFQASGPRRNRRMQHKFYCDHINRSKGDLRLQCLFADFSFVEVFEEWYYRSKRPYIQRNGVLHSSCGLYST